MKQNNFKYLQFVFFSTVKLWDVKRFILNNINSKYPIRMLGDYIIVRNEKVKPYESPEKEFSILGVNNKTGLFDAYIKKGKEINQPYKKVYVNDLAYNPYRINVGSIGIKTEDHKNEFISPAYIVFSCNEKLNPGFLFRIFQTETFNKIINENTTGSVRQNLTFDTLANIRIPVPPIDIQNRLLNNFNKKIQLAEEQEKKSIELEQHIEDYLSEELGIEKQKNNIYKKGLNYISFKELSVWGVTELLNGIGNKHFNSKIYSNVKLSSIIYINPRTDISNLNNNNSMSFIPMTSISSEYGEIIEEHIGKKCKSKGYTKFQNDDLIWARITPCMENGKSAIAKNLINKVGYGSTEFHVLRKKDNNIMMEYLHILLRTKIILSNAVNYFTGSAGQQRVPKNYLENLYIPFPPLKIQQKIVNYIQNIRNKIKELKSQGKENRETAILEIEKEIFN